MRVLLLVLFIIGCSQGSNNGSPPIPLPPKDTPPKEDPRNQDPEPEIEEPQSTFITLDASKMYFPDDVANAVLNFEESIEIILPESIPVVSGNAGNYYSLLTIDNITCYYEGGSAVSYPLHGGNITNILNGQKYNLVICRDENSVILDLEHGDTILVQNSIGLEILDGDSTVATVVKLVIEVLP